MAESAEQFFQSAEFFRRLCFGEELLKFRRVTVLARRPPRALHSLGMIIFSQDRFPTNPLRIIQDARFLLIPGVLQQFEKRKQKEVRDYSLFAAGRIPIGRRFGERRSQSRRLDCRNIDRRNRSCQRFNRERFFAISYSVEATRSPQSTSASLPTR